MPQPYIGEIRMFAGNFAPLGWMFCEGQMLNVGDNQSLAYTIGTTYGGDGVSTFALPDLRGRLPIHQGNGFAVAQQGGVETVTLAVPQIPTHTHSWMVSTASADQSAPAGCMPGNSASVDLYVEAPPDVSLNAATITPTGGTQPHENCQPYLCVNFIISLDGLSPIPA